MNILSEILRSPWCIDMYYAQHYTPMINALLTRGEMPTHTTPQLAATLYSMDGEPVKDTTTTSGDMQAVVPITGPITKYSSSATIGTEQIGAMLQQLDAHDNVARIILRVDSPGGAALPTIQLAEIIENLQTPTIAYIDGMAASAAMWLSAAADQVLASTAHDIVGSIGTVASWADYTQALQEKGIKEHRVYATKSTQKQQPFRGLMDGSLSEDEAYAQIRVEQLDPLNEAFHAAITKYRGQLPEEVYTGRIYRAQQAVSFGLIDGIRTFADVIGNKPQPHTEIL